MLCCRFKFFKMYEFIFKKNGGNQIKALNINNLITLLKCNIIQFYLGKQGAARQKFTVKTNTWNKNCDNKKKILIIIKKS